MHAVARVGIATAAAALGAALLAAAAVAGRPSLSSPSIHGGLIASATTCDGAGIRPALAWAGLPAATRSVAIEVVDPDTPLAGGFTHWLAWNIEAGSRRGGSLAPGQAVARQGVASSGATAWVGPCPPSGVHLYVFTLYALRAPLTLAAGADRAAFDAAVAAAKPLAKAVLKGSYGRKVGTAGKGVKTTTRGGGHDHDDDDEEMDDDD